MKSHAPKAMGEPFDKNLVTKMWVIINNNTLLTKWLSEFLKLAKFVLRYVEDECTFSMLNFMKDKLHNRLKPNLDTIVWMFVQKFYTHKNLFYQDAITTWKDQKVRIGVAIWKVQFISI